MEITKQARIRYLVVVSHDWYKLPFLFYIKELIHNQ
jgi:hypothetical protein